MAIGSFGIFVSNAARDSPVCDGVPGPRGFFD
jgi:hypothetical protein